MNTLRKRWRDSLRGNSPFSAFIGVVLFIFSFFLLFVLFWAFFTSFKSNDNFNRDAVWLPQNWTFDNYAKVFQLMKMQVNTSGGRKYAGIGMMFLNSILYAGGCAFFQTITTASVAYLTARYDFKISKIIHYTVIITLILPIVGNLASLLQLTQALHLYDTMIGSWIMKVGFNNVYYLIFYAAFKSIPKDYAESAFVDGASHFRVYWNIYLPMILPLVGTVMVLLFVNYWNDYQVPYVFLPDQPTIALGLYAFQKAPSAQGASYVPVQIAAGVVVFIPIFLVFLVFRKRLMGNLLEGGLKG
jgi:ABC-type glycerol-3-phosphate transport system permease component